MTRKRISIALLVIWIVVAVLAYVFGISYGAKNPPAQPAIMTFFRIYICTAPLMLIVHGLIEKKELLWRTVIGILLFIYLVWSSFFK